MVQKDFIHLIEENVFILGRLADRLKVDPSKFSKYTKLQMAALVRLHVGGRAKLKDIASRECITAPALCAMFKKLERDGMVARVVDQDDRRNTWYSVTPAGSREVGRVLEKFRKGIATLFSDISVADESRLTQAVQTMNEILKKMEIVNA